MRTIYLIASVTGFVLPYLFLIPFLREYGLDLPLLVQQMFANPIAGFFAVDVILSSLVLWVFVYTEGKRLGMRHLWLYVLFNLTVGVSLALPAFLYAREGQMQRQNRSTTIGSKP
jgi:hypothetical protein